MSDRAERFARLDEPQRRGDASEAIIKAAFAVRGITVLTPAHDNGPYDLVLDLDGRFIRIQSKTAYAKNPDATVAFETRSTRVKSTGYERDDYVGEIEYFAVYNPVLDEVYLVHVDEAPAGKMVIRHAPPANNQVRGVNWHEDYLLDERLGSV